MAFVGRYGASGVKAATIKVKTESSPPNVSSTVERVATPKRPTSTKEKGSLSEVSKKRDQRPYDDLPQDKQGIDAARKDIMRDSNGKPNKEQKAELEKLKTQEKALDLRNIQKRKN